MNPYNFTVRVTDNAPTTVESPQSVDLELGIIGTLPSTAPDTSYRWSLPAGGGTAPYTWSDGHPTASVVALLNFDEISGPESFADASGKWWSPHGNIRLDSTQFKFGGSSCAFDGVDDYLSTASSPDWHIDTDYTIEMWVYPSATSRIECLCTTRETSSGIPALGFALFRQADNSVSFTHYSSDDVPGINIVSPIGVLNSLAWNHVAVARTATGTVRIFVNGAEVASGVETLPMALSPYPLRIGWHSTFFPTRFFTGNIDDFRITKGMARYTRNFTPPSHSLTNSVGHLPAGLAIDADSGVITGTVDRSNSLALVGTLADGHTETPYGSGLSVVAGVPPYTFSEVPTGDTHFNNVVSLLHFNGTNASTTFTDVTGKVWTRFGNAQISTAQARFGGSSGYFDGAGDYITSPDSADWDLTTDFTVEAWVRFAAGALGTFNGPICAQLNNTGSDNNRWHFGIDLQNNVMVLYWRGATDGTEKFVSVATAVWEADRWYHVAATIQGTTWRVFRDGVLQGSATNSEQTALAGVMHVGAWRYGAAFRQLNGWLDDFRITKGVARYTSDFTPIYHPFPDTTPISTLPDGLSLNTVTGRISGTPTTAGTSTFTIQVTDTALRTATSEQTIEITT